MVSVPDDELLLELMPTWNWEGVGNDVSHDYFIGSQDQWKYVTVGPGIWVSYDIMPRKEVAGSDQRLL